MTMIKKFCEPIEKLLQEVRKELTDLKAKAPFHIKRKIIVKL